ncbi:MAG TPA: tetratricopeptide repeat protein [Acidobacteriota bacterium]
MDTRVLILTLPSAVILALLVAHSLRALPRPRALAFWIAVIAYGLARGLALELVIGRGLESSFPYVIHEPLLPVFGVPLQELAGWAIVCYLGWWLGWRLAKLGNPAPGPPLFVQVAWACLFLGAVSWAVESAAVAAGWWHWSLTVSSPLWINVPFIGLVDWFFVGIDFLLPFAALTAPALKRQPLRWLALLAFPLHFSGHLFVERVSGAFPIPVFHLIHWLLLGAAFWLAMRSRVVDDAFSAAAPRLDRLAISGLAIVLLDIVVVEFFVVRQPELWPSLVPCIAVALQALRPAIAYGVAAAGALLGLWLPALFLAAVPAAAAWLLGAARRRRSWMPAAAMVLLGAMAYWVHAASARREARLVAGLDRAIAARDAGDLAAAVELLERAAREHAGSHVPRVLLGEIYYRTDRLAEARAAFREAVRIKPSEIRSLRHLAVIDLRTGRAESAARWAGEGLAIEPEDNQLAYLASRATGRPPEALQARLATLDADQIRSLAGLAFEVGDKEFAAALLDRGIERWPLDRWFHRTKVMLSLAARDRWSAGRALDAWLSRLPEDREAQELARRLAAAGGENR